MHVRVASAVGRRRLTTPARRGLALLPALAACCLAAACHRTAGDVTFEWTLSPTPPAVDLPVTLSLRLRDGARRPVSGARLRIDAHMSHPGMAPVLAPVTELGDGAYAAALRFTMGGDWMLVVSGTLVDGARVQHRIDVPGVRSSR